MEKIEEVSRQLITILSSDESVIANREQIYNALGLGSKVPYALLGKSSRHNALLFFALLIKFHFGKRRDVAKAIDEIVKVLTDLHLLASIAQIKEQINFEPISSTPSVLLEEEPISPSRVRLRAEIPKYSIQGKTLGNALIVNFVKFDDSTNNRLGAKHDTIKLKKLFTQLKITCSTYTNLNISEFFEEIQNFIEEFDSDDPNKVCIVVILSHGGDRKDSFLTKDGQAISVDNELLPMFDDRQSRLKGKPKIFIFGFCRGENYTQATDSRAIEIPVQTQLNDMFCIWSTIPDRFSMRDEDNGTWFIESFCKVTEANFEHHEIKDIMQLVEQDLRQRRVESITQQCTYNPYYFKRFYFTNQA